jgi:anthranilate/para-aminobenzoate synthase component I
MENKYIIKATGEREEFNPQKLRNSLERSNASTETIEKIISQIEKELKTGDSTREIYAHAFALLKKEEKPAAVSYSLRKAILDLGPTGFPFEQFVSEVFYSKGFETTTDYIAQGECVEHEIDIVAWNKENL